MKTAISVPDSVFARVEVQVEKLGISRSEFYARAAQRYLDELEHDALVDAINASLDPADDSNAWAAEVGRRRLAETDDEW